MARRFPITLKPDEAERLKAVPNVHCRTGLRDRVALELMHRSGLRVSEVCNLRPEHIDYAAGLLEVRAGKGKKDRTVPLGGPETQWLRQWQSVRPNSEWLLCTLKGTRMLPRHLQTTIRRYAERASLPRARSVTPHTLRHTFATDWLRNGGDVRTLQVILGHEDLATTMIYCHVYPEDLIRAKREMERREIAAKENLQIVALTLPTPAYNDSEEQG